MNKVQIPVIMPYRDGYLVNKEFFRSLYLAILYRDTWIQQNAG